MKHAPLDSAVGSAGGVDHAAGQSNIDASRYAGKGTPDQVIADLERRLRELTAELEAAHRELAAFSHSVSHDLRAPLRGIDGWSLALLEDCPAGLDALAVEYLGRIRAEAGRMGRLIDDLRDLSRHTLREMEVVPVDLSALASEIARELLTLTPQHHVDFHVDPGLVARGDLFLLRIALGHLLSNAWKFTAHSDMPRVEFTGSASDTSATSFAVRDNGAGFDMSFAAKLFVPFRRLHRANEYPGNGIGLATVQRIVARHGGRIWAEAAPGRGATFHFTLEK